MAAPIPTMVSLGSYGSYRIESILATLQERGCEVEYQPNVTVPRFELRCTDCDDFKEMTPALMMWCNLENEEVEHLLKTGCKGRIVAHVTVPGEKPARGQLRAQPEPEPIPARTVWG